MVAGAGVGPFGAWADVYWNPGDNIARHNLEFAEMQRVASTWSPPVALHRVDCPSRLEDEILFVRDRYANPRTDVSQPGNRLDIFRVEASWLRAFNDSLVDLMPIFGPVLSQFDPRSVAALTVEGKLLAVPSFLDTTLLYYRADLLRKYNLSVPETWDDLERAAKVIQKGERAAGVSDFWGLMWQGAANEVLTALTYAFIGSFGGGTFINASGGVDIVNKAALLALERVRGWLFSPSGETITPVAVLNEQLHETKLPFLYERAAFLLDLTHIVGEIHTFQPDGCDIFHCGGRNFTGRASYTQVPGLAPQTRAASPWYWGWAVNKRSPQLDEVMRVVRYLGSRPQQLFKARNGDPPTLLELQENSSATCSGLPEPTICTLPMSKVTFLDRHLSWIGARYFTLPTKDNTVLQGVSPLVFGGLRDFLLDGSDTPEALLQRWACKIGAAVRGTAEMCQPCPLGWERADDLSSCRLCHPGDYGPGQDRCLVCRPGTFANTSGGSACMLCENNTFAADAGAVSCTECRPGYHNTGMGQTTCEACPAGTAWDTSVQDCAPCPLGSVAAVPGSLQCFVCSPGTFAAATGQSKCQFCHAGYFQATAGATACAPCSEEIAGSTSDQGSETADACVCRDGLFWRPGEGCLACPEGLVCPQGRAPPLQGQGYYGHVVDQAMRRVQVFRCAERAYCPEGAVGTCAPNRIGLACDNCAPGSSAVNDGSCEVCGNGGGGNLQTAAVVLVVVAGLVALARLLIRTSRFEIASSVQLGSIFGVTTTFVQCLATFAAMNVEWVAPLSFMQGFLQGFGLNVNVVQPGCGLQLVSAQSRYLASAAVVPLVLLYLVVLNQLLGLCGRRGPFRCFCNAVGKLLISVFLSVMVLCITPFQCTENPSGPATVVLYRSVQCWAGDPAHQTMVATALVLLLLPLAFTCWVIYATLQYPRYLVGEGGIEFMEKYDFIFSRFRPESHFFGIVVLIRSVLLGFAPATSKQPEAQLMEMAAVFAAYGALQSRTAPWRSSVANLLDSAFSVNLVLVCVSGSMLARSDISIARQVVEGTLWVCFAAASVGSIGMGGLYVKRVVLPRKRFAAYLCQPRGATAPIARLFKEVLGEQLRGSVYLEVDELGTTSCTYSTVAEDTRVLIALLTHDTLRRHWCAVELAAAVKHKVKMVLAAFDDYEPPTEGFLESELPSVWSPQQWLELDRQGCSLDTIRLSYRALDSRSCDSIRAVRSTSGIEPRSGRGSRSSAGAAGRAPQPVVRFATAGTYADQLAAIGAVGAGTGLPSRRLLRLSVAGGHAAATPEFGALATAEVLVTGRAGDPEALGICHLLQRYLQQGLHRVTATVREPDDVPKAGRARYLVVVLTPGILEGRRFAQMLDVAATVPGLEAVPVLAAASFNFPAPEFYEALLAGHVFEGSAGSLERAAEVYQAFFQVFASDLSPQASAVTLSGQVSLIMKRLHFEGDQHLPGATDMGSEQGALPRLRHLWTTQIGSGKSIRAVSEWAAAAAATTPCAEEAEEDDDDDGAKEEGVRAAVPDAGITESRKARATNLAV